MHGVQEYQVTLYLITHTSPAVWCHVGPTHHICEYIWLCECPSLMIQHHRKGAFLQVLVTIYQVKGHFPPHLFHTVISVFSVRLPFTWLPMMNLTESISETSKWLSKGSSSSPRHIIC